MAQLRHDHARFLEHDTQIIAIGPEGPRTFARFWQTHDMPFIGIPDPAHHIARIFRQEVNLLKLGRMPAMFVIDKAGNLVYQHYGESMSDIPSNEEILEVIDEQNRLYESAT